MKRATFLLTILILIFSNIFYANPIPSGSALTIVAPTTITQPGNYRFGNDIVGTIVIDANDVEIDLENRTLTAGSDGIAVNGHENVTIKNGIITDASTNGILVDTCTNICIESITFLDSSNAISVLTTTAIKIEECSFSGHTAAALNLEHVNSGQIQACSFSFNAGPNIILGLDCNCIMFKNITICNNIFASGIMNGLNFLNSRNMNFENCHFDGNTAENGTMIGWNLNRCIDSVIKQSSCNTNVASVNVIGFGIDNCFNVLLDSCQTNSNTAVADAVIGFLLFNMANNIILTFCEAGGNSSAGPADAVGFLLSTGISEIILKHCIANRNTAVAGPVFGFVVLAQECCLFKCIAKANMSVNNQATGFNTRASADQILVQDCIAKFNMGGGGAPPSNGFVNSGSANVFFRNSAQRHGALGAGNFSGIPNIAAFDPIVGTYTPPAVIGDHPNTDNISITVP